MRKTILIFLSIFITEITFATRQIPDYLIIEEDTIAIFSNPLEQYFELVGKRDLPGFKGCGSTACWRGYKAIWRLRNDSLFLEKITTCHRKCGNDFQDANLNKMFGTNRVFAYWFSGKITAPKGKLIQYVHMGYGSVYEEEQIFTFKKGKRTKSRLISNKKIIDEINFRKNEMEVYKLAQDTLFYYVKNNIDWLKLDSHRYLICDELYNLTFSKKGKIKKVKMDFESENLGEKLESWWWNNIADRKCRRLVKKALKPLDLSHLSLPSKSFNIDFEVFYNSDEKNLELWKPFWMER